MCNISLYLSPICLISFQCSHWWITVESALSHSKHTHTLLNKRAERRFRLPGARTLLAVSVNHRENRMRPSPDKRTCKSCSTDALQRWRRRRRPRASLGTRAVGSSTRWCQQEHYNHMRLLPETLKPGEHVFAQQCWSCHWEDRVWTWSSGEQTNATEPCTSQTYDVGS